MEVLISAGISVLVGVGLWAFLPRGAILVRSPRLDLTDTWEIENASAVPVRLRAVKVTSGMPEWDEKNDRFVLSDLTHGGFYGTTLQRTDFIGEDEAADALWAGAVLRPGEKLLAHVQVNSDMTIHYRRDGWTGHLERRTVEVHGHV
ncbi:MAG: hypothetical protein AAGG01_07765 [Planctomycetota bacterium]